MDKALELLSFRARSESELEKRLLAARHSVSAVVAAIERCRELGYLDDRAFALAHVRDRLRLRPKGRRALRSELHRRGVDRDLAEEAIEEGFLELGVDERALVCRVAEKRAKTLSGLDPEVARRRLTGYLARRGFSPPAVRDAVDGALPRDRAGR